MSPTPFWPALDPTTLAWHMVQHHHKHPDPLVILLPSAHVRDQCHQALEALAPPEWVVRVLPDWEILPYERFSPHPDLIGERLKALVALAAGQHDITLVHASTALGPFAPASFTCGRVFDLKQDQILNRDDFVAHLKRMHYQAVPQVREPGTFACRGALMDVYPMGAEEPVRLWFDDDRLERLKAFDPENQRSVACLEHITYFPATEHPMDAEGRACFRARFRDAFPQSPRNTAAYEAVSQGRLAPGLMHYLPLFFPTPGTLMDYVPDNASMVLHHDLEAACHDFWKDIEERYAQHQGQKEFPLLPPQDLFLRTDRLFALAQERRCIRMKHQQASPYPPLPPPSGSQHPLQHLSDLAQAHPEARCVLALASEGRLARLDRWCEGFQGTVHTLASWHALTSQTPPGCYATCLPINQAFCDPKQRVMVLPEAVLFAEQGARPASGTPRQRKGRFSHLGQGAIAHGLDLTPGDLVVHVNHGVGVYEGLVHLPEHDHGNDLVLLRFAGQDKLYVPVTQLDRLQRYRAVGCENIALTRLGGPAWEKTITKAAQRAHDTAAELMHLAALREQHQQAAIAVDAKALDHFADAFPFEETPDQKRAIQEMLSDLKDPKPMDRLICGDVGFGKTEVALRAAFAVASSGQQVLILVPTTLLAQQHGALFEERFAPWPLRVAVLSRFQTPAEKKQILNDLAQGSLDVLVGTHRLLQDDVRVRDLGLAIIDEEHRFGVRQKERMKRWRTSVNVLTMTATPIPRTLHMALSSLRSMSLMATPPERRLSTQTWVRPFDRGVIREAITRELLRGGQVYYLHNDVASMDDAMHFLQEVVPEAKLGMVHGQMSEHALERVMSDFYHQRFQVLVCSTIIETGLDVPSANTIVIERADRFGLAQLHQLRGRVGRAHHQAYAYLLLPESGQITQEAQQRLEAFARLEALGAGFMLATHDLEIRGSGHVLGEAQSGSIDAVGLGLYGRMLARACTAVAQGDTFDPSHWSAWHSDIDLNIPALLPESYIEAVDERLRCYGALVQAKTHEAITALEAAWTDRFGPLPEQAQHLCAVMALKHEAEALGIVKVTMGPSSGSLTFGPQTVVSASTLMHLIQKHPKDYRLAPDGARLLLLRTPAQAAARLEALRGILALLRSA